MILFFSFLYLKMSIKTIPSTRKYSPLLSLPASVPFAQCKFMLSLLLHPCRVQNILLQRHEKRTSYIGHSCPMWRGAETPEPTPEGLWLSRLFFNGSHLWGVLTKLWVFMMFPSANKKMTADHFVCFLSLTY